MLPAMTQGAAAAAFKVTVAWPDQGMADAPLKQMVRVELKFAHASPPPRQNRLMNLYCEPTASVIHYLPLEPWMSAAAEDLTALAWLHEAEQDVDGLCRLRQSGFPDRLVLVSPSDAGHGAMAEALDDICRSADRGNLDYDLAADYAASYRGQVIQPACESAWLDENPILVPKPSLVVRRFFQAHGLDLQRNPPANGLPDDHLSNELAFLALLMSRGLRDEAIIFLEDHLLLWLPSFVERVTGRSVTRFYTALARLTSATIENLYDSLI